MKTRRSRKSLEPPPPPRPRRRNKRKSGKGRPLKAVNETVVVLSDSEEEECGADVAENEDIQVVDIADVSDAGSQPEEVTVAVGLMKMEVGGSGSYSPTGDNMAFRPLAHSTVLPSPTAANLLDEPNVPLDEPDVPEVPVIDIGDDESEYATQIVDEEDDDDGVEVIAVLVSAKKNQRLSRTNKRKRSSIGERDRKSNGNLSTMQDSIKKAKNVMRRSSSSTSIRNHNQPPIWRGTGNPNPFPWNGISANSRQISRGKKKKSKKAGRVWNQQGQPWASVVPFNRNRAREFNREIIFRPESNTNPVEEITVNFANNGPSYPNPCFQSFGAVQGSSRGEARGAWIPRNNHGPRPAPIAPGSNIMNVGEASARPQGTLRPVVIDGSNIAVGHGGMLLGGGSKFSARGIQMCVDYFLRRGHQEIVAFVPRFRLKKSECRDPELLEEMERAGHVRFTPSREAGGERIASYDDLYVVQYAHETGGIIISNDNFKDLFDRKAHLREIIRFRLLQYTWITPETLMFPEDPLGRNGPSLDEFLRF